MLTITNGSQVLTVTKGAYESMYAPQGWEKLRTASQDVKNDDLRTTTENKEIIPTDTENVPGDVSESPNEDDFENAEDQADFSEIPLSEMSVPQLKAYGNQLGVQVDTDSAKTLRNRIRKALEG